MAKLFFLLSGEHDTLPASELEAILGAENYAFKRLEKRDQTLSIETDVNCVEAVKRRAALTRLCALELFTCEAEISKITKLMHSTNLREILSNGESFAVRVKRVKNYSRKLDVMFLERKLGEIVLGMNAGAHVNLKNPDKTFTGIITDEKFLFGVKLAEIQPKQFIERRPKKKPFFHPSAMPPKIARCMVNLAKPKTGELVFDPFCGTGSMIIEAALMGCRVIGLDVQRRMANGAIKNLKHFAIEAEGIVVADARKLPVKEVDCIVTDPPYGRSASTFRRTTKQLVEEVLTSVNDILKSGKRICIASPRILNIGKTGEDLGYEHVESHFVYVHRSLTREIAVFEKV